jgi:hypothetical protein
VSAADSTPAVFDARATVAVLDSATDWWLQFLRRCASKESTHARREAARKSLVAFMVATGRPMAAQPPPWSQDLVAKFVAFRAFKGLVSADTDVSCLLALHLAAGGAPWWTRHGPATALRQALMGFANTRTTPTTRADAFTAAMWLRMAASVGPLGAASLLQLRDLVMIACGIAGDARV